MNPSPDPTQVVDVDLIFPSTTLGSPAGGAPTTDLGPTVNAAIRDVLGYQPRAADPRAFVDALKASFRLSTVEGHVDAEFVPRGYALQTDLGAVSGGQASLYRRATLARTEILRILDGITPLRSDADPDDTEAFRSLVRNSVERLVDELGAAGGPRTQRVDEYFRALLGVSSGRRPTPDTVGGQVGALRDRYLLTATYSRTVPKETVRTSFWTLADLIADLQIAWKAQHGRFTTAGDGFLGTDLLVISTLLESAAQQVDEFESVLDSVWVNAAERRTVRVDKTTGLTLDGLLGWLRSFLADEGRHVAQEAGRDGIVSTLAPTALVLYQIIHKSLGSLFSPSSTKLLARRLGASPASLVIRRQPDPNYPPGMYAARTRVAVASLYRVMFELVRVSNAIGANPPPIPFDVNVRRIDGKNGTVLVSVRGLNMLPSYVPVFLCGDHAVPPAVNTRVVGSGLTTTYPDRGSTSTNDDHVSGRFTLSKLPLNIDQPDWDTFDVDILDVPVAIVDTETGTFVHVPDSIPDCGSGGADVTSPPKGSEVQIPQVPQVPTNEQTGEAGPVEPADLPDVIAGRDPGDEYVVSAEPDYAYVEPEYAEDATEYAEVEPSHESVPIEVAETAPGDLVESAPEVHATTLESAQEPVTAVAARAPRARTPRARRTSPQQP